MTSFRFFPFLGNGTVVRPLSLYPLAPLVAILIWQIIRREIKFSPPDNFQILLLLLIVVILSGLIGNTYAPPEITGVSSMGRFIRALLTVFIGFAFYFATFSMIRTTEDIRFSLIWLFAGLAITFIWGCIQFYGLNHGLRGELLKVQNLFSVRGLVKNKRVSGFAYEPSWLASQLTTIYIPWIAGALVAGVPLIKIKWQPKKYAKQMPLMINLVALGLAIVLLLFTYSRSGLAVFVASAGITFLVAGRKATSAGFHWFFHPSTNRKLIEVLIRVGLVVVIIVSVLGVGVFLNDKGYISAFFQKNTDNIFEYLQKAYLGPRFAYLSASYAAFEEHPLTGVGLGSSGFWVLSAMPDWALSGNLEIARLLSPSTNIFPNPKNLFARVLAETGIFGFILLSLYFLSLFGMALYLFRSSRKSDDKWALLVGVAGIFGATAVLLGGFSQDSFAMPELWITPGILAGTYQMFRNQERGQDQ